MKNCKRIRLILLSTILGIIFYSCQNDDGVMPQIEEQTYLNQEDLNGFIKLGKKLENPYSVKNMKKALENLKQSSASAKSSTDEIKISTTHLYIKFIPKSEEELDILKSDPELILYTYPLDYEMEEGGYFYRDPEVPINQPTYQYCAVKVDKVLPKKVESELLSELFIPDENKDSDEENGVNSKLVTYAMVDALVDEALRITNNLDNIQNKGLKTSASSWRPAGTIIVWDDDLGFVGIEGLKVQARRWFTTHTGFVNASGYYSCDGTFKRDANYSFNWERYDFQIKKRSIDGLGNTVGYTGPKKTGNWDLSFKEGVSEFYGTLFRASYHYFYKDIKELRRPPNNSFWKKQMTIEAWYDEKGVDDILHIGGTTDVGRRFNGDYIRIFNPERPSMLIYGAVIHNLAHASHWKFDNSGYHGFISENSRVVESWAKGVEFELTKMIYPYYNVDFSDTKYPHYYDLHTDVVEDLIDGVSEYDQVSNYTIKQIEDALEGQNSWNGWRDNIIGNYINVTENQVDELFKYWE